MSCISIMCIFRLSGGNPKRRIRPLQRSWNVYDMLMLYLFYYLLAFFVVLYRTNSFSSWLLHCQTFLWILLVHVCLYSVSKSNVLHCQDIWLFCETPCPNTFRASGIFSYSLLLLLLLINSSSVHVHCVSSHVSLVSRRRTRTHHNLNIQTEIKHSTTQRLSPFMHQNLENRPQYSLTDWLILFDQLKYNTQMWNQKKVTRLLSIYARRQVRKDYDNWNLKVETATHKLSKKHCYTNLK